MQDEGFEATDGTGAPVDRGAPVARPSRQAIREERRKLDAVDRRRKLIGLPILALGLALVAAGLWSYREDDEPAPTEVGGISIERTTTSTTPATTTTTMSTTTSAVVTTSDAGASVGSPATTQR